MQRVSQLTEREIYKILYPTVGIFLPLLEAQRSAILKTPKRTFAYGSNSRHKLDIYYPSPSKSGNKILVFCYGGGLNSGSRTLPDPAGLSYGNLGMYFSNQGFITVVPDYRLSPTVKYPEAARDVRDAVEWILDNPYVLALGMVEPDLDSLYIMGHSAGAVNVFTMLAHPELYKDTLHPKIAGVILFSGGYSYDSSSLPTTIPGIVQDYYGGEDEAKAKLPFGLLNTNNLDKFPRILLGVSEHDPTSFLQASDIFSDALTARDVKHEQFVARGHNHISVTFCLGTGEGEEWAMTVSRWISQE